MPTWKLNQFLIYLLLDRNVICNLFTNQFCLFFCQPEIKPKPTLLKLVDDRIREIAIHELSNQNQVQAVLLTFSQACADYCPAVTVQVLEFINEEPVTFREFPQDETYLLKLRQKVNKAIAENGIG